MVHLQRVLWLAVLAVGIAARAGAEDPAPFELEGTWHVLVHYKDSQAHNKDLERWEDRVWVLRRDGGQLHWTEYPIVVFDDKSGRFERSSTNRAARVLDYWEPNPKQRAELEHGPAVNSRGSQSKRLREVGGDWRSMNAAVAASASIISFTANWSIEDPTGLPTFRMEDVMGSAMSENIEGGTVLETRSVEEGGDVLRGDYDRDGTRTGTFRLQRTAPVRGLGTKEEQEERIRVKLRALFGLDALEGKSASIEDLSEEQHQELRDEISKALLEAARVQRRYLRKEQVESLTNRVEQLLREGKSPAEIERMFAEGKILP